MSWAFSETKQTFEISRRESATTRRMAKKSSRTFFLCDVQQSGSDVENIFISKMRPGTKHEKIICDARKKEKANRLEDERTHYTWKKERKMVKMTLWQKEGRDIWLLGLKEDSKVIHFCLGSFHFVCGMMISLEKATIVLATAAVPGRNLSV